MGLAVVSHDTPNICTETLISIRFLICNHICSSFSDKNYVNPRNHINFFQKYPIHMLKGTAVILKIAGPLQLSTKNWFGPVKILEILYWNISTNLQKNV